MSMASILRRLAAIEARLHITTGAGQWVRSLSGAVIWDPWDMDAPPDHDPLPGLIAEIDRTAEHMRASPNWREPTEEQKADGRARSKMRLSAYAPSAKRCGISAMPTSASASVRNGRLDRGLTAAPARPSDAYQAPLSAIDLPSLGKRVLELEPGQRLTLVGVGSDAVGHELRNAEGDRCALLLPPAGGRGTEAILHHLLADLALPCWP
jgi:hypothetical protein